MNKQYASVKQVDFHKYNRIVIISDIHGDPEGFSGVLKKAKFSGEDALVIAGDILGRGNGQLKLLQMVTEYAKTGNLYMVRGNHDGFLSEWYDGDISDADMLAFLNSGRTCIVTEMAEALGLAYQTAEQLAHLKQKIRSTYAEEIEFLESLPEIIDSNVAIFVHAGIQPGPLEKQDYWYCLTAKAFAEQEYRFEKPVIVGHWPASNYSGQIININSYFKRESNIIAIDGGNSMKSWMQINYLILDGNGTLLESGSYDHLPRVRVLESQEESRDPVTLIFPKTRIEIKETNETESVCYVPHLDREMTFENRRTYPYKGDTYCFDFTTYHLPVKQGEVVTLCRVEEGYLLIKRDGIVGKYAGAYEMVE